MTNRLKHTAAQAFRAMMELPGHQWLATPHVASALGQQGLETALSEITQVLLQVNMFNSKWINVTTWSIDEYELQAITRHWHEDGVFRTEFSLKDEQYGGFTAALAESLTSKLTPQQRDSMIATELRPLTSKPNCAVMFGWGPYFIVCIPSAAEPNPDAYLPEDLGADHIAAGIPHSRNDIVAYFQSEQWGKLQRDALEAQSHCSICDQDAEIVHHRRWPSVLGRETQEDLTPLCVECAMRHYLHYGYCEDCIVVLVGQKSSGS